MALLLNENDKQIIQPSSILIPLMSHQKTIINKMLEVENNDEIVINYKKNLVNDDMDNSAKLRTNIGILADKVGAGKTLTVISLISIRPLLRNKDIEFGGSRYFTLKINSNTKNLNCNLIIVPHKLVPQWKTSFEKATNINLCTITTNKDIDKLIKIEKKTHKNWNNEDIEYINELINLDTISSYNVILIGETMYKRFYKSSISYKWNRIFIDEADTIKLPRDMECKFNFMWIITGTPNGLSYSNKPYVGRIFKEDTLGLIDYLIIKNSDDFIDNSIILPHPKRLKIRCLTPKELSIIKDLIPASILQMINAGNSDEAIKALNCNIDTNENILQVITKNLCDSISNKQIELEAEQKKYYPLTQIKDKEFKIKIIENNLKKLQEKYDDIKKKIYDLNNDYCPVCMSSFTNPVIVNCCKNCFCFDCLAVSMGELNNNKCPYCTTLISKSDMHIISNNLTNINNNHSNKKINKHELKDKLDVLVDLIEKKPDGSFMIFANYSETFSKIEKKLNQLNISYHILKGQATTVKKYIDDFENKTTRVLMLNAQYFGAGMNLQMTTDLIIYHRFSKEMEEQIIGRAQRLGRKTPLNVYYLIHDNESDNIEDKFKFEDINDIHYLDWIEQQTHTHTHAQIINNNNDNDNNNHNHNHNHNNNDINFNPCESLINDSTCFLQEYHHVNDLYDDKFNSQNNIYNGQMIKSLKSKNIILQNE